VDFIEFSRDKEGAEESKVKKVAEKQRKIDGSNSDTVEADVHGIATPLDFGSGLQLLSACSGIGAQNVCVRPTLVVRVNSFPSL